MKGLRFERRSADDARLLGLLAAGALLLGLYAVHARYEPAIAGANERSKKYYARIVADDRLLRRAAALERMKRAALADLRRVPRNETLSEATARFIGNLQAAASESGVSVTKLEPDSTQPQPPAAAQLQPQPMTLEAQGRFAPLLRFIVKLAHGGSLVQITGTQFALVDPNGPAAKPRLKATVHAVLYRLHPPDSLKKAANAAAN